MLLNQSYRQNLEASVLEASWLINQSKTHFLVQKWLNLYASGSLGSEEEKIQSNLTTEMDKIRSRYRKRHEEGLCSYPSSRPFSDIKKEVIEQCRLFSLFRMMPKGALLHVHSAAALSVDGLLDLLEQWERDTVYIVTGDKFQGSINGSLFFDVPGLQDKQIQTLKSYLEQPGNREALRQKLTLDFPGSTTKFPYIWDEFNRIFARTSSLFENKHFYKEYHIRAFQEMMDDNIDYVELRCGFQNFEEDSEKESELDAFGYRPDFLDVLQEAADEVNRRNRPRKSLNFRVILCARRDLDSWTEADRVKLMKKTDAAIFWRETNLDYKNLIIGFDYVSEEDRGKCTYSYYQHLIYGDFLGNYPDADQEKVKRLLQRLPGTDMQPRIQLIDFYLHDGESLWENNDNITDAMPAVKFRIGHGFQMSLFPNILNTYTTPLPIDEKEWAPRGPVLEICPISNQMLGYTPELRSHPLQFLLKNGVPCTISNDDPQIFGNPGLSYDFWEIYMASSMDIIDLKALIFTAYMCRAFKDWDQNHLADMQENDYLNCLRNFNKDYWTPFLRKAKEWLA